MSYWDDTKERAYVAWQQHGRDPVVRVWCDCSQQAGVIYLSPLGPVLEVQEVTLLDPLDVKAIRREGGRRVPEWHELDPFLVNDLVEVTMHGTTVAGEQLRAAVARARGRSKPEKLTIQHGSTPLR